MTFEEFITRKKISLSLMRGAEPVLFNEFRAHYEQMGEKSFDHTKKYWFNQLRRRFPAPAEIKAEKVIIENQLAEQTITDALTEPVAPAATIGFKPRFKAAIMSKPVLPNAEGPSPATENDGPAAPEVPKPTGFKPRFKPKQ